MEPKNLTFPGAFILGAGLVYLLARFFSRRNGVDMPNYTWLR